MTNYLTGIRLREVPPESSYLSSLPVVRFLNSIEQLNFTKPVTFLVGENGTGKSTILEAIAVAMGFNAEGGSRDFSFSTKQSHSELYQFITTIKTVAPKDGFFLRAESFYNTASYLDENSTMLRYGLSPIGTFCDLWGLMPCMGKQRMWHRNDSVPHPLFWGNDAMPASKTLPAVY